MTQAHDSKIETHEERELALRNFGKLLELQRDIERNQEDARFVRDSNGKILYVFDLNVVEFFIRPKKYSHYTSFFSGTSEPDGAKSYAGRAINAQSALITGEYLFSGALPGARDGSYYMTEWHFREFYDSVQKIEAQLREELEVAKSGKAQAIQKGITRFRALTALIDKRATLSDLIRRVRNDELRAEVAELRKMNAPDEAIRRFVIAREAAGYLVNDSVGDPLQQLGRVYSDEIAGRLTPLHTIKQPSTDVTRESIRRSARFWFGQLAKERRLRQEYSEQSGVEGITRSDASLWKDARALAYVLWLSSSAENLPERYVFVTGDNLVFNAYRRWHVDEPGGAPFVLRRVAQYAPILNFKDAPGDVAEAESLFQRTRAAVETVLLAFNLSRDREKGREYFALTLSTERELIKRKDPRIELFVKSLSDEWFRESQKVFGALAESWQRLERIAIGSHYDFIERRLGREQGKVGDRLVGQEVAEGAAILTEYLDQVLTGIEKNSIRFWQRLASEFIRAAVWRDRSDGTRRVPMALRLEIPIRGRGGIKEVDDLSSLVDKWIEGDRGAGEILSADINKELLERPDIVYATAATLALKLHHWSDASRFAELADSAHRLTLERSDQASDEGCEFKYLHALAERFRIGDMNPSRSGSIDNVWRRALDAAVKLLTDCEDFHRPGSDGVGVLRQMRAISERAAARLFYASWGAVTKREVLAERRFDTQDLLCEMDAAISDLRLCRSLHDAAQARAKSNRMRQAFFLRLERQYITNICAAIIVKSLLLENLRAGAIDFEVEAREWQPELDLVRRRIGSSIEFSDFPPVAQVDMLGSVALIDRNGDALTRAIAVIDTAPRPYLSLDEMMLRAIKKRLLATVGAGG